MSKLGYFVGGALAGAIGMVVAAYTADALSSDRKETAQDDNTNSLPDNSCSSNESSGNFFTGLFKTGGVGSIFNLSEELDDACAGDASAASAEAESATPAEGEQACPA